MIGTILDHKYRITELIGSGGMAQVYKAINMSNRRIVAVKMLKDEFKDDAEFLRRFTREANAVLALSHENIVRAYGAGTHNGLPYLVMEYVEGHTLKDLIEKNGALPVRTAIGITCQILDALSAAHSHGIIHRDVKPQNVIVTDKGRVKLADFGIAREARASTVTFSGQKVLGSVHYISPEQAKGSLATEQSDLYSVGVCLYEMLTGTVPFESDSTVSVALMHLQEKPVPPIELVPDLPKSLNDIVLKDLEKDPENRYHTAREMRSDLVRSLSDPNGTFVNDPDDTVQKNKHRPSVYILIAMCVFLPIMLIGIFVLIYATSCKPVLPLDPETENTEHLPEIEPSAFAEDTPEPQAVAAAKDIVPNLIGYTLDDALHLLYAERGFSNLIVEFTDLAENDTPNNTVVSIYVYDGDQVLSFEQSAKPIEPVATDAPTPVLPEETSSVQEPTFTPSATEDTETVVVEVTAVPEEETVPIATTAPTVYSVEDSDVTPSPDAVSVSQNADALFATDTPIRLKIYRKSLGSYKADVSFTLSLEDDLPENLVEIGYETTNFEDIPYRVILHSQKHQKQATSITETATVRGYEQVTRTLYLYVNNEVRSTPQSITFAK